ncbi:MAG: signal peptidase I [Clostridia bacterium]|nr:signal peptidase I [Clostridia bacterium]
MRKKKEKKVNPKLEKAKTVFKRVMSVITALSFLLGFAIFVSVLRANKGEVPSVLGYSVMRVRTGSMEPTLGTGCIIIAKKTAPEQLKVGDIISFYSTDPDPQINGQVETHRIVEKHSLITGEKEFITKGDANTADDAAPVLQMNIIGRVIFNLGVASGSVLQILQNPKVIFFLIILPLIFITFSEAVNLVNLIVNRDESEEQLADETENVKDKDAD